MRQSRRIVPVLLFFLSLLSLDGLRAFAAPAEVGGRVRQRFDAGWRFRRDPETSSPVPSIPIVWLWHAADVRTLDVSTLPAELATAGWQTAMIGQDVFRGRRAFAWFRADIGKGTSGKNGVLHFEGVDDNVVVFLNGKRLFQHAGWDEPFDVPLGETWNPREPNILTLLVENTGGGGGVIGPVTVEPARASGRAEVVPVEARPGYEDSGWRSVHLPHDYVVEGTFTPRADTSHGSLPSPPAWYRKTFTLPETYRGKSLWIDFDGIYRKSTVWLNGHKLGDHPSGYIGCRYDITPYANVGGRNVLAVRVDPRQSEGWWYEGGGIYRHVWLNAADPVHVAPWGTFVRSSLRGDEALPRPDAEVVVDTALVNDSGQAQSCALKSALVDPKGKTVAAITSTYELSARGRTDAKQTIVLPAVALWSIEKPNLYRLVTTVSRNGQAIDRYETPFGIRTIRFDAEKGFFLNGKPVKIKGTCNHQDHAGVGVAIPDSLFEWRIRRLQSMGSNAYRCSHNPPAPELLDACDRLGMIVMDETRHLGDTERGKSPVGTKADNLSELKSMLLRDRNHPSIVMWSMFNEENLQGTPEGGRIFAAMKAVTKSLDPTRPVTQAMNYGWGGDVSKITDLQGVNYSIAEYERFHKAFPTIPVYGSETASTVSTRGIYANDTVRGYVSAYDVNHPEWAETAEHAWKPIAERPWLAGGYVWTGFDYKGEPTPYNWPCINSHFGILDICGFPKDNYWYYQAWWGDKPVVHLLPHWNWSGKEGQTISVWCHSNADQVELFLNGQSLGAKEMPRYSHLEWEVPYQPGVLEAKGYRAGRLIASDRVETTSAPAALRLKAERRRLAADSEDILPVEVEILDAKGRVVPTADNAVEFRLLGAGTVAGVGNGDPSSHEPDKASRRNAFNGRCMVLVQATSEPGSLVLTASSPGLKPATLTLTTIPSEIQDSAETEGRGTWR